MLTSVMRRYLSRADRTVLSRLEAKARAAFEDEQQQIASDAVVLGGRERQPSRRHYLAARAALIADRETV